MAFDEYKAQKEYNLKTKYQNYKNKENLSIFQVTNKMGFLLMFKHFTMFLIVFLIFRNHQF
jgi:hypothetical protein